MGAKVELLTPVGRLVQGSLYSGKTTDAENRPLVYKSGANLGQPRMNFWFAVALQKGVEQHWNQTEWGKKIWDVAHAAFPNGQTLAPTFAWKIVDGDSIIPNTEGNRPCDYEGFPNHWVLKFSCSFAPSLFNSTGTLPLTEPNAIQLGDFVQVYGSIQDNESTQRPGVYLNPSMVAHAGFGQRILIGADPKAVGFGNAPLPAGASLTPVSQAFVPVPTQQVYGAGSAGSGGGGSGVSPSQVAVLGGYATPGTLNTGGVPNGATVAVNPYPAILTPPIPVPTAPPVPQRIMLPASQGASYEDLIAAGWTDALLIQHGLMQA